MKKFLSKFEHTGLFMFVIMLTAALFGVSGGMLAADVVSPEGGGAIRTNHQTDLGTAAEDSPNLTLDEIEDMVTLIKPYSVELDTIARKAIVKTIAAPTYRHYTLDVMDLSTTLKTAYAGGDTQAAIETNNDDIFSRDETIIVPSVNGYESDGVTLSGEALELFISGKDSNSKPLVRAVNGAGATNTIPAIAKDAILVRAGAAGSESQIKTDPFSAIPTDWTQFLQKHLCQVEQTEMFQLVPKEVKWTFTEEAEAAVFDMRRKMNVTNWLGVKAVRKYPTADGSKSEDRYFSKGVWWQAGNEFDFNGVAPDITNIPSFLRAVLTGNNSSKEKFFLAGSGMIEAFEKSDYMTRYIQENGAATEKDQWGLQFNGLKSKFGKLWVLHAESLDELGMANMGMVIDFNYLLKVTYGMKTNDYDLRTLFIAAANARTLEEQYALLLKNPKAHTRVYLNK